MKTFLAIITLGAFYVGTDMACAAFKACVQGDFVLLLQATFLSVLFLFGSVCWGYNWWDYTFNPDR